MVEPVPAMIYEHERESRMNCVLASFDGPLKCVLAKFDEPLNCVLANYDGRLKCVLVGGSSLPATALSAVERRR
jgi:hypothetical protein